MVKGRNIILRPRGFNVALMVLVNEVIKGVPSGTIGVAIFFPT